MLVIADASPLNVRVRIECVEILPGLFHQVVIPPAVHRELSDSRTPAIIRDWVASRPAWLRVQTPAAVDVAVA